MAIIQISKIQQRSGNLVDLPQLDEAQFGWANDARRLFIGTSTPNPIENVEVLTSYSNISFSQIDGSYGNLNINIANANVAANSIGEVLAFDGNNWINAGANAGGLINLGDVANVKINDGAVGYVLTTDGYGNLSWTSKTTAIANIIDISTDSPAVMTFDPNVVSYTNGTAVTILGVEGNANSEINGETLYLKVSNTFNTTGEVTLYTDDALSNAFSGANLTYTNSPNATATSAFGINVSSPASGVEGSIQYNVSGVLTGSASLKFANSNVEISSSNVVVTGGNVSANIISGNLLTGTLTTAAQPNITSTGTLAGLVVAGHITPSANITYNLGNNTNRFNDLYLANSTIYIGAQTISANSTNVIVSGVLTANLSGNATTAGTVTTAAQPNITSVGSLTSLSVVGNITTGNLDGANSITANYFIGSGNNLSNIQGANITGAVSYATTANSVAAANVSGLGNIATINLDGSASNILYGNGVFAAVGATYSNSDVATFLASYGSNTITTTGNVSVGNIIGNGQALSSIAGANVTGTVANATYATSAGTATSATSATSASSATTAGTVTTAAQPNITSTGTLSSISVSGNANIGNIGTAGLITATGNLNAGNIITGGVVSATGNITAGLFVGDGGGLSNINIAAGSSILNGNSNVSVSANSNVTISVSGTSNVAVITNTGINVTGTLSASGNITTGNLSVTTGTVTLGALTTGANTTAGTITGNWTLTSGSKLEASYADLAEYYEADQAYDPGTVLAFGGEKEVTIAEDGTTRVAGVVSTNPAYAMNANCQGIAIAIALQGRVPTKVRGNIRKGDMMVSGGNGFARPSSSPQMGTVIGKALENFDGIEGVIEIAVGRL
jgi:hypothetical protein